MKILKSWLLEILKSWNLEILKFSNAEGSGVLENVVDLESLENSPFQISKSKPFLFLFLNGLRINVHIRWKYSMPYDLWPSGVTAAINISRCNARVSRTLLCCKINFHLTHFKSLFKTYHDIITIERTGFGMRTYSERLMWSRLK